MQLLRRQTTWDPMREFDDLSKRFGQLFGNLTRWNGDPFETLASANWAPACDITETDKEYRIRVELPNVTKDDVHVTLENGILTIQGERREEKEDKGTKVHRRELSYGSFQRRFTMPEDVSEGKIDASFKNGMLEVLIPRSKTAARKSKEISIH